MGKKVVDVTPRYQIKKALDQLWLRSRERGTAIKRDGYTCRECGAKQSKAKGKEVAVEVHHLHPGGRNLDAIIEYLRTHLLCPPEDLVTLCKGCHDKHTKGEV